LTYRGAARRHLRFSCTWIHRFYCVVHADEKETAQVYQEFGTVEKSPHLCCDGGGLLLALHFAYFISWPLTSGIALGYVSALIAAVVWLTGAAFLERFRDSLFFHGSLTMGAISLIVIHAASAGINFPIVIAYSLILVTTLVVAWNASRHTAKTLKAAGVKVG
jgi:hypothetical protein